MRGITPRREQGMADPVLASMVHALGMETARHYTAATPKIQAYRDSWVKLAPFRDGPINPKATDLGADMVGVCRLQPHMIDLGADMPHEFVIVACVAEDYDNVVHGANAV